jgi:hypothetical protein
MARLTISGVLLRLLFAVTLVLATYNPSGHSYLHWFTSALPEVTTIEALAGVALLIAWALSVRATLFALGRLGLALAALALCVIILLLVSVGWLDLTNHHALSWILLVMLAVLLAIGMSWPLVRRRPTGQTDVDKVDRP